MTTASAVTEVTAARTPNGSWTFASADAAVVASAIPAAPPAAWFEHRQFDGPTPLTFTADGQIYGHIADRSIPHIGLPGHRTAPKSKSGYRWFTTGQVRCDDDTLVATGRLTMLAGHADLDADAATAAAHYDNVATAVADVIAWDDEYGVAVAGAARPGTTAEQMRMAMASPPSGDWRVIDNDLELVAALLVNVPGFPTPRAALAASGAITALVAAGAIRPKETPVTTPPPPPDTADPAADPVLLQTGDVVTVDPQGGQLMGVVNAVDPTGVTVEVVCDPAMLTPAEPVTAGGRRIEALERQLRAFRAQQLLDRVGVGR